MNFPILSSIIFLPLIGALFILFIKNSPENFQVWSGNENEWLFGLSHNRIAWWIPDQDQLQMETVQGPIQDAICSEGNWLITGWREDIVWKKSDLSDDHSEPSCTARPEIGTRIVNRNGEGHWVLDNRGKWTRFASKSD